MFKIVFFILSTATNIGAALAFWGVSSRPGLAELALLAWGAFNFVLLLFIIFRRKPRTAKAQKREKAPAKATPAKKDSPAMEDLKPQLKTVPKPKKPTPKKAREQRPGADPRILDLRGPDDEE